MRAYSIAALLLTLAPQSPGQAVAHFSKVHTQPARGDADFAAVLRPGDSSGILLPDLQNVMEVINVSTDPTANVYVGYEYDPTASYSVKLTQVIGDPHALVVLLAFDEEFKGASFHFGDDSEVMWFGANNGNPSGLPTYANLYLGRRSKLFIGRGPTVPQVILPNGTKIDPYGGDYYATVKGLPSGSTHLGGGSIVVFRDGFAQPEPGLLPAPPDVLGCTTDVVLAPGSGYTAVGQNWIDNSMYDPSASIIGCVEPDMDGYSMGYCTQLFFPDNTLALASIDLPRPSNLATYGYPTITFGENVHLVVTSYNYSLQPPIYNPLITRRGVTLSLSMSAVHGGVEDHSGNFIWGDPHISLPPGMTSQFDPASLASGSSILIVTK